jgi:hypothetical protein
MTNCMKIGILACCVKCGWSINLSEQQQHVHGEDYRLESVFRGRQSGVVVVVGDKK